MFLQSFAAFLICFSVTFSLPVSSNDQCSALPFSKSANDFGFELTKRIGGRGNLFISPLSIYTALSMTYLGAGGKTAEEMERAFRINTNGLSGEQLHKAFQNVLELYSISNNKYSLNVANGLFTQKDFSINKNYVERVRDLYQGEAKTLDFSNNPVEATKYINNWVDEKTKGKIHEFLKKPLNPAPVMALLNAVYFKGTWKSQFNKNQTYEGYFYKSKNEHVKAKLMQLHKVDFPFFEDSKTNYKFLELPYKGQDISMILALPKQFDQFPDLEMSSSLLCKISNSLHKTKLERVYIPKFHLEYETELKGFLAGLGIKDLFTNNADLSGINGKKNLQVSSVLHKAVVDVNEEGSEAAGVTSVIIQVKSSLIDEQEFVANHPFLFYIVDKRNGLVLFSGRVVEP